ncbi:hypothetical protein E2C01_064764 [Portunus trituberculatus]|uniref:Uncharacterized protein n=1 Tax=Portunus trituberculatus TaxID=210409 RepID=A0A5B7HGZ9_PORTR|nr:hypothetical protein [Portunus trituberculatus]
MRSSAAPEREYCGLNKRLAGPWRGPQRAVACERWAAVCLCGSVSVYVCVRGGVGQRQQQGGEEVHHLFAAAAAASLSLPRGQTTLALAFPEGGAGLARLCAAGWREGCCLHHTEEGEADTYLVNMGEGGAGVCPASSSAQVFMRAGTGRPHTALTSTFFASHGDGHVTQHNSLRSRFGCGWSSAGHCGPAR